MPELCDRFCGKIVGVDEDTENGHRLYGRESVGNAVTEIIAAAAQLLREPHERAHYELPTQVRETVAAMWLDYFNGAA